MTDVIAAEIGDQGPPSDELERFFDDLLTNPFVIALDVAASRHLIGGVLIGVALVRSRLIPRWLAIGATLAPKSDFGTVLSPASPPHRSAGMR